MYDGLVDHCICPVAAFIANIWFPGLPMMSCCPWYTISVAVSMDSGAIENGCPVPPNVQTGPPEGLEQLKALKPAGLDVRANRKSTPRTVPTDRALMLTPTVMLNKNEPEMLSTARTACPAATNAYTMALSVLSTGP